MYVCSREHGQPCASAPRATYHPNPFYPEEARRQKLSGRVVLSTIITTEGTAANLRISKSAGHGFDEAAIECVKRWKFDPGLYDGKPVPVAMEMEVDFKLY